MRNSQPKLRLIRLCLLVCMVCVPLPRLASAETYINVGALRSVYLIRYGQSSGTGFILTTGQKRYLITAAHVIEGIASGERISVRTGWDKWEDFIITRIPVPKKVDIAVFTTDRPISAPGIAIEVGSWANRASFPDVYFLGFPFAGEQRVNGRTYTLSSTYQEGGKSYPVALVKHGILAGIDYMDPTSPILLVDAINNPGFSGSPLLLWDGESKLAKVIGVVTARLPDDLIVPAGVKPPPVWENSGIVIAHDISGAIKAINDFKPAASVGK